MKVRINRDHQRKRWTVCAADGRRIGHCIGLLLEDVAFETQGPSGWAIGTLVSWGDLAVDPKFQERLTARMVTYIQAAGENFHPVSFDKGEFFVYGSKVTSATWLRVLGREAECAGARSSAP
jgi:hypothetical protein